MERYCGASDLDVSQLNATVQSVLEKIKNEGDAAVIEFESKFDHVNLKSLAVSADEMDEAEKLLVTAVTKHHALILAHHNIAKFHESQKFESSKIETQPVRLHVGKNLFQSKSRIILMLNLNLVEDMIGWIYMDMLIL